MVSRINQQSGIFYSQLDRSFPPAITLDIRKQPAGLLTYAPSSITLCIQNDSLPGASPCGTTFDYVCLVVTTLEYVYLVGALLICGGDLAEYDCGSRTCR